MKISDFVMEQLTALFVGVAFIVVFCAVVGLLYALFAGSLKAIAVFVVLVIAFMLGKAILGDFE